VVIGSRYSELPEENQVATVAVAPSESARPESRGDLGTQLLGPETPRTRSRFVAPAPPVSPEKAQQLYRRQAGRRRKKDTSRQGLLPLEIVSKGRFEKSEVTLYDGEDLDVPTYIRRGVVLPESVN
jgi:cell division protein FtsZ